MLGPLSPHASWRWHPVDEVDVIWVEISMRIQRSINVNVKRIKDASHIGGLRM